MPGQDVTMPQLGETVTEGTITRWFKAVGDSVGADEPLFEVSTDKVDTEVPSPIAGTLSEIRAQEGDVVAVGAVIAVVGDAAAAPAPAPAEAPPAEAEAEPEAARLEAPEPEVAPAPEPEPQTPVAPAAAEAESQPAVAPAAAETAPVGNGSDGELTDVTLPQLGESITEGTITRWFKQAGDTVGADEPLFEVSTDKVDTEVPSPVPGVLAEIVVEAGSTVEVGSVIARVGSGASAAPAPAAAPVPTPAPAPAATAAPAPARPAPAPPAPAPAPPAPAPAAPAPAAARAGTPSGNGGSKRLLSPVVRRLVNDNAVDVDAISGSGPGGRITREDVLAHIERPGAPAAPAPAPAAPAPQPATAPAPSRAPAPSVRSGERDDVVPLSKIRKLTGDHMIMSRATSPHAFSVVEVDYANVDVARNALKGDWKKKEGFSLTYLPFISRAIIDALGEFPHLNASLTDKELIVHRYVDLGVAVDMDYAGLIVPIIREADSKRLRAIAREISDLADRARRRKLGPDEIQGGTFTISNNGSAGSVLTAAIINQPQVAIVSTDAIKRRPVAVDLPGGGEGIAVHPVGNLAMSWDHRAFDGAYAAGFLVKVKDILETRDWTAEL